MQSSTLSGDNTVIGSESLINCNNSYGNQVVGNQSLQYLIAGSYNIAIGTGIGSTLNTGDSNILIGKDANASDLTSSSIAIGREASVSASNQIAIGSTPHPVGTVTVETETSTKTWEVIINGNVERIMLV
jgi:hypothetical protein